MKIRINNTEFVHLISATVSETFNASASTFNISVLNNVIPKLLNYDNIEIFDNDNQLLLTGTLLSPTLISSAKPNSESFDGYSKTGILEDCTIPSTIYPLQSDNLNLTEIATKVLNAVGVDFEIDSLVQKSMNKKYLKSTAEPGTPIISYLKDLAAQRSIIISHTKTGKLLFTRRNPAKLRPVARFVDIGANSISLSINAQAMHSDITVMRQASTTNPDSGQYTIKNPYVETFRPVTRILNSGDLFDVQAAARMELSKELAEIKLNIISPKYVDPGQLIEVKDTNLRINNLTEFFVEQTVTEFSTTKTIYTLTCVLRDVYNLDNYNIKPLW